MVDLKGETAKSLLEDVRYYYEALEKAGVFTVANNNQQYIANQKEKPLRHIQHHQGNE